jgi:hypothetical protein
MLNKKFWPLAAALVSITWFSGCGSSDSNSPQTCPNGGTAPNCNPAPVPPNNTGQPQQPGPGACVPLQNNITFSGTGVTVDSANIYAGQMPPNVAFVGGRQFGQMSMGGPQTAIPAPSNGQVPPNQQQMQPYYSGNTYSGYDMIYPGTTIQLKFTPANQSGQPVNNGYPQNGYQQQHTGPSSVANISGVLTLSPQTQQEIVYAQNGGALAYQNGGQYNQNGQPGQPVQGNSNVCISNIALNLGQNGVSGVYGEIYLYLNNSSHGYVVKVTY